MKLRVDRVGAHLAGVHLAPDLAEAHIVLATAQRAGAMAGGERGRLIEKEQLGEAPGLHERAAVPVAEAEPAGDPASAVVVAPDASLAVVEAATVPVDQTAFGRGDQLAKWRDPVLQRHAAHHTGR